MKNDSIGINYLDCYIPDSELLVGDFVNKITGDQLPKSFKNAEEYQMFIEYVLGLKSIRIESNKNEAEMLGSLMDRMFENTKTDPLQIDLILMAQDNYAGSLLNIGKHLQYEKGMHNAYVLNVNGNQCANTEIALKTANDLMLGNPLINKILILTSVKIQSMEDRVIDTYAVLGDGAGLLLVTRNAALSFINSSVLCNGFFSDYTNNKTDSGSMHTDFYKRSLNELLRQANISSEILDHILIQNANPLLITQSLSEMGIGSDKIFDKNLSSYGHLDCLDFIINLKSLVENNTSEKELNILSMGIGFSGVYISTLLKYNSPLTLN